MKATIKVTVDHTVIKQLKINLNGHVTKVTVEARLPPPLPQAQSQQQQQQQQQQHGGENVTDEDYFLSALFDSKRPYAANWPLIVSTLKPIYIPSNGGSSCGVWAAFSWLVAIMKDGSRAIPAARVKKILLGGIFLTVDAIPENPEHEDEDASTL
ncbi:hypothetical protein BDB00DRAFT_873706 [Zychaea mexicana]|uniref:uncharacterized protein n=1 Tax=Zychaea mexicana TaxID=64656 RepID=UPI0022FE803B|nr:uncharacterized protein BDB00DRAFT_873706 [Zychaea mexicana]KAI9492060.1 hypothetical protein BDB00DRAFT_873706 [Zychaea mexicana]